ncbi:MAG: prepilin-type N-terminal cleavage/methylation domain-containing protein [Candidatus Thiodiazotropha sp.]|nr:prepilin-type N-terminal cleavage/methylation domain-containing protein [Candidatus Thiodiazotropha sp.]MCM8883127.1 prepilin-type N-terminal cleavage/methylation domain-containing protein [Candidatus Thiodiazotropha sp.]MCM8921856.1 prepilin-type N-terminal cleavage/methylation domain-containing protein [Candidatus Thiodiazotropha sp.]
MKYQQGLTLLELTAVVAVLGITALVVIPNLLSTDPHKLELAAQTVAEAIRFARDESIRTATPYGIIWPTEKRVRVYRADMDTNPPAPIYDVYHPISKQLYDIDLEKHPFTRVDRVMSNSNYQGTCSNPMNTLFDDSGTAYCWNPSSVICLQGSMTLTLGEHVRRVDLDGMTGRVTVQ